MKKLAIALIIVMAFIFAWGVRSFDVPVTSNGREIECPLAVALSTYGEN